ncbi:M20 metallopeptidase family protein [Haematomicrobium sanguinis]|uniref:M20 metallopeptidase family protein n=1 Tax=Haematomicrobium sanguinis TaxID=479106 RepID=UPI00047DDEB2|nr:M20 family metallopeptidase [Haematomicrobium sanguinis]
MTQTQDLAQQFAPDIIALRRELHQNPELGLQLPWTQQRVLEALDGLDLEITQGQGLSSITAVLRGTKNDGDARHGADRPVVLLRGDMDGLPVKEETGLEYASTNGNMHACGHDLHTAGLVGAAKILHAMRDQLDGDVVFMFQPAEELPGGAEPMIAEGVLDAAGKRADAAYGLHVLSNYAPRGVFAGKPGTMMAAPDSVYVKYVGAGGHGSMPDTTLDPIPALCEAVGALQTLVTRRFSIWDPVVVTVGRISGGTKENIIPDSAEFDATIRSFSPEARARAEELIVPLLENIARGYGLTPEVRWEKVYPVTVNDDAEAAFLEATVREMFGEGRYVEMANPVAGGEDFSFVLEEVPGAFVFLGAAPGEDFLGAASNHSPVATFDDAVLPDGAALLAELAVRRINR